MTKATGYVTIQSVREYPNPDEPEPKGILNKEQGISNDESNAVLNISTFLVRYSLFKKIFCQKKQENQN